MIIYHWDFGEISAYTVCRRGYSAAERKTERMIMCSKCHKRMAVVFITKMEDGQRTSEGLCLRCARESGLPVNQALDDITKRMGITPEQLENTPGVGKQLAQTIYEYFHREA